jgi:translation initiation factor 2 subunit 2
MELILSLEKEEKRTQHVDHKRKMENSSKESKSKKTKEYLYENLLVRLIENLKKSGVESEKKERLTVPPPRIGKDGTKKTVVLNFKEICLGLNREKEHLLLYISSELGAFASIQNGGGLVLRGRYQAKGIESILRNYINEYVLCGSCKSADTFLDKDSISRLFFILCNRCKASRSVNHIKQGYIAQVKRKKAYK